MKKTSNLLEGRIYKAKPKFLEDKESQMSAAKTIDD